MFANSNRVPRRAARMLLILGAFLPISGCALTPSGTTSEQAKLSEAGRPFEPKVEERQLPELPAAPAWDDVLHRAFLANGELEEAYFEWKAAVERIEIASAYPNSNVSLGYSYMFSSERMKSFDRQTFSAGFDSSVSLSFPTKAIQKGKIALDDARVSGERFRAAKFDLQRRVLGAWADYALLAARLDLQRQQRSLKRLSVDATLARAQAGGVQRELLNADVTLRTADEEIRNTEAELSAARATLNGMLAREPDAPLPAPPASQPARRVTASDEAILAAAAERNPELAILAHQVQGRVDALELARQQWIPDISPTAVFTGGVSQAIGAAFMLPTNIVGIQGGIREAQAMQRASEAALRQAKRDRAASLVATLIAMRSSERQARAFEEDIVPLATRMLANAQSAYAAGAGSYTDLLEVQRTIIEARFVATQARAMREKQLAELEALIGVDMETLNQATAGSPAQADASEHAETQHVE